MSSWHAMTICTMFARVSALFHCFSIISFLENLKKKIEYCTEIYLISAKIIVKCVLAMIFVVVSFAFSADFFKKSLVILHSFESLICLVVSQAMTQIKTCVSPVKQ